MFKNANVDQDNHEKWVRISELLNSMFFRVKRSMMPFWKK